MLASSVTAGDQPKRRGRPPGSKNKPKEKAAIERLGYRIDEFAAALNISRSTVHRAIRMGEVRTAKLGKSTIIPLAEAQRLMTPQS